MPRISWPSLSCIYLTLCATGVASQQIQLAPLNSTVLRGSDVKFNATVQGSWQSMTWQVGGILVATVFQDNVSSEQHYSVRFCLSGVRSCVEFTIHNATRQQTGPVLCMVNGVPGQTAQLQVQESGTVSILQGNVTAVRDQQVEFQCVTSAWFPSPTVSWTLNDEAVNSSLYNTTVLADGDYFNSTTVLSFQAVADTRVRCQATILRLPSPASSSVFLTIAPSPPDWTVLIAVVASFSGCALLVLLILGIVFCYKRRKEKQPSYQDEISKRVRTQSEINVSGQRQGQVNAGYQPDGQTSPAPSDRSDSGFSQVHGSSIHEVQMRNYESPVGNGYSGGLNTVDGSIPRKHRHLTIV